MKTDPPAGAVLADVDWWGLLQAALRAKDFSGFKRKWVDTKAKGNGF